MGSITYWISHESLESSTKSHLPVDRSLLHYPMMTPKTLGPRRTSNDHWPWLTVDTVNYSRWPRIDLCMRAVAHIKLLRNLHGDLLSGRQIWVYCSLHDFFFFQLACLRSIILFNHNVWTINVLKILNRIYYFDKSNKETKE